MLEVYQELRYTPKRFNNFYSKKVTLFPSSKPNQNLSYSISPNIKLYKDNLVQMESNPTEIK